MPETELPSVTPPTFEHHHNGFGIEHPKPRLSWKLQPANGSLTNWKQTSYEVEVSWNLEDPASEPHRNQLFEIESTESVLVPWPSQPLASRDRRAVRVRVMGTSEGQPTPSHSSWSEWATVEAALLDREEFKGSFITSTAAQEGEGPLRPIRFRKTFSIPEKSGRPVKARLYVTALGVYEASLNGKRVGDHHMSPGWTSYKHRLNYEVFDVTSQIVTGANVIGVEVGEGWYAGRLGWVMERYFYGKDLAAFVQLEVEFEDKPGKGLVVSNESWKCGSGPIERSEIYDGEVYDAAKEATGWCSAGDFDDSTWVAAKSVEFPSARLVAPDQPPVRVTQEVKPEKIFKSKSGKTIIDFGQNLVGKLRVAKVEKPAGHEISFRHAEVMENEELGIRPLRVAKCTDTIRCSGSPIENWSPKFTYHGFRYVQVDGWDDISEDSVTALVMHTNMQRTGWFSCSNPLVNKLHENTVWSMRGNFFSIPTDCPQRDERLGWTGDIQVFSPSASYLYDTSAMLGHWLEDVALEQAEANGVPPFVVPDILEKTWGNFPQAVWDDATILVPWALYKAFGDATILRKQYPSMKLWLDQGLRRGPDGLWDRDTWQLGDWLDPIAPPDRPDSGRTSGVYVADAYLVHITHTMSLISSILGESADAARYTADHTKYLTLFQQRYISPLGLPAADSQTGLALALRFHLHATPAQAAAARDQLSHHVRLADFRVATGFAGTPMISHALSAVGLSHLAYRMLLEDACPSWLYPIRMGATTIWERWDSMMPDGSVNPGGMTSFNHYALGSIVDWLHSVVGGLAPKTPGWREILVRPVPGGGLGGAQTAHETPYGRVEAKWKLGGAGDQAGEKAQMFELEIVVPPNTTAYVVMPDMQRNELLGEKETGRWVGSGRHVFSCEYVPQHAWPPKAIHPEIRELQDKLREAEEVAAAE